MKKTVLAILSILSVGAVGAVCADDSATATPAARNAALFASGAAIRISPVYYVNGVRYHHRRVTAYRTDKIITYSGGVRYVRYRQVPIYTYW